MSKGEKRIGELGTSNEGYEMKIIEYKDARNVTVEFQDEYKDLIPKELYNALYRYEIEVND